MGAPKEEISYLNPESGVKIKLIRGQRGAYGWEISISEPEGMEITVLDRLKIIDSNLQATYGQF